MQPTLVLLHGFPFDSSIWREVTALLPPDLGDILTPDQPGFGGTAAPTDFSLDAQAEWLDAYLTGHQVKKAVLAGHSMGGYLALAYAARYPQKVAGLALIHSTSAADSVEKQQSRNEQIAHLEANGARRLVPKLIEPLIGPKHAARLAGPIAEYVARAAALPTATLAGTIGALRDRPDRADVLRNATFPVLILAGTHDPVVPPDAARAQQALVEKGAQLVEAADSGHMAMLEEPAVVAEALGDWMQSITKGRTA